MAIRCLTCRTEEAKSLEQNAEALMDFDVFCSLKCMAEFAQEIVELQWDFCDFCGSHYNLLLGDCACPRFSIPADVYAEYASEKGGAR